MSAAAEAGGEQGGVPRVARADGDSRLVRAVWDLVEEEGDLVAGHLARDLDDILCVSLGAADLAEVVARERYLGDLAVLPDVEGAPGAALQLDGLGGEGAVEDVVDEGGAHAVLQQVAGGAERAGARGVVGEAAGVRDDRHPQRLRYDAVERPFHPLREAPDDLSGGGGLGVDDRDRAEGRVGHVMVDHEKRQLLGEGACLRGKSLERGAVHGHEDVELAVLEPAQGHEVGDALQEAGLAEGLGIGGGDGVVAGRLEEAGERDHGAERIPIRAKVPRDEDAFRLLQQLLGRLELLTCLLLRHVRQY